MNTCTFIGRLVKDPEIKMIREAKVANFTIAVNKRFKSKSEDAPTADFIPVSVWRSSAEFAEKYFCKGKKVFVVGNLETYSYDKDGKRQYGFRINSNEIGLDDYIKADENKKQTANTQDSFEGSAGVSDFGEPADFYDDLPF